MVQDAQYLILVPHAILDGVEIHVQRQTAQCLIVRQDALNLISVPLAMMDGVETLVLL